MSGALLALALMCAAAKTRAATRYVFTTFLGDDAAKEKLSVYTSSDGLNFKLLANTNYGGPTGVLRDPTIMKHSDGKYYVAYTLQSWTTSSKSFGIASSSDLQRWTFLTEVPAGVTGAMDTWAPEWFQDSDGVHLIVNIDTLGTDSDFRSYDFKAKDASLMTWEAPVPLGIGPNNIDTFVVKDGSTYHAFSKNESTKYIEHATATALHGPWTWVGKADWAGWGSGKEGIALFKLDDGQWRMFLDCYSGCGFLYANGSNLNDWSKTMTVPGGLSGVVRHGTVLREELGSAGSGGGNAGGTNAGGAGAVAGGGVGGAAGGGGKSGGSGGVAPAAGTAGAISFGGASAGSGGASGGAVSGGGMGSGGRADAGSGAPSVTGGNLGNAGAAGAASASGGSPLTNGGASSGGVSVGLAGSLTSGSPAEPTPGCGCSTVGESARGGPLAALTALAFFARRKRR